MKRVVTVGTDAFDCYVRLEIDLDVMTPDLAAEIHEFHSDAADRLDQANGDLVVAVALLAAPVLLSALIDGYNGGIGAMATLHSLEGWPDYTGIEIVDFEFPRLSWENMLVFSDL